MHARSFRTLTLSLGLALSLVLAEPGLAQNKKPIKKSGLVGAIKLNALSTTELVGQIEQRGVDFQLNDQDEAELRTAGARPEVIAAVKANYRTAAPAPAPVVTPAKTTPPRGGKIPAGGPLSQNEIMIMLHSGAPAARIEQFVEARGVDFAMSPEVAKEIKAAGGSNGLIGAITAKAAAANIKTGPDYDELTDQAQTALRTNNSAEAIRLLQQAVQMDAAKPTAYGLLGVAQLYGSHDVPAAEQSMRAAVERGGGASFRAYHDHDGFFKGYCQGSLFVTKTGITFKADDGNHTFEATRDKITETGINTFVGMEYGSFHLKVNTGEKKAKNYNFAPMTKQKAESNLIIKLYQSFK